MVLNIPSIHAPTAKMAMVRTNFPAPMPLARMAVTSLSAARRLSPTRMPTNTPIGKVMMKVVGSVKKKISATLGRGALLRTINSSSRPRSRMKMMKVNNAMPSRACELTSFRM